MELYELVASVKGTETINLRKEGFLSRKVDMAYLGPSVLEVVMNPKYYIRT